jgi:hypothetical protein
MPQKHRKCDSSKYRRRRASEKSHHINTSHENEWKRDKKERAQWQFKEDQRLAERQEVLETIRLRRRLLNLLTFRMWQMDPVYYDQWARTHQLREILGIFAGNI